MKPTETALKNGWGWVLGVSGQECRVHPQPRADPAQILAEVARILSVDSPDAVPAAVRRLATERRQALASAARAWSAVHHLTAAETQRAGV